MGAGHGETRAKDSRERHDAHSGVHKRKMHMEREDQGRGHRDPARSGDADDGEDAEVDSALPRRRYVVRDHGLLLGLGVVLLLGLGSVLDLDLERAELVVPSKDAVILPKRGRGGGRAEAFSLLWAAGRSSSKTQSLGLGP